MMLIIPCCSTMCGFCEEGGLLSPIAAYLSNHISEAIVYKQNDKEMKSRVCSR